MPIRLLLWNTISGLFFRYDVLSRNVLECIQTILSLLRHSGSSADFDSFIHLRSCIPKVKFKNLYQSNPRLHGSRVRLQVYIKNIDPYKTWQRLDNGLYIYIQPVVKLLSSFTEIYILDIVPRIVAAGIKLI